MEAASVNVRACFVRLADLPVFLNQVEYLEHELDEDIYPVMTYPFDFEIKARRVDVEAMVIEREQRRQEVLEQLYELKQRETALFSFMDTLTMREAQALRCAARGELLPQCTTEYTGEVLESIQAKLRGFLEDKSSHRQRAETN